MNQRISLLLIALVIAAAICGAYSNHFHNAFHFDDAHTIEDNGYIRDLKNIPLYFKDVHTSSAMPSHQGYRPLVTTTLAIDYALGKTFTKEKDGYNTLFYHISNFSWFLIIVILLYVIQVKLYNKAFDEPYNRYFALLGCAWYGLNTVNAETINYVISRSDILSTLGIVGSMAMYIGLEKYRKYYFYLIPAIIGMFAKETTIMFAPALMVYDYLIEQDKSLYDLFDFKQWKGIWNSLWKGLPALVICVLLAALALSKTQKFEQAGTGSALWYRLSQPYICLHYVTQFFFPFGLSADTDIEQANSIMDDRVFYGMAFLIGLVVIAFQASKYKRWKPVAYGILWFLLMLLPTAFVALAEVTNDHRVFLPNIGLVFAMVCVVANLFYYAYKDNKVLKYGLLIFLMLVFSGYGYGVYQRNKVWNTDETLWKDVTEKSPRNGRGWMNYGLCLMGRADYTGAGDAYTEALKTTPYYYILHINMGVLAEALGKKEEAEQDYKNALAYGPGYVESYYYYARYLFNNGRVDEAEVYCNKGLDLFAGHLYSRYLLMDILNYKKDWKKLAEVAQATLSMYGADEKASMYLKVAGNPGSSDALSENKAQSASSLLNLSLAYYRAGKFDECIATCYKAIALQPNYPEAYNNLCSAYNSQQKWDSGVWACNKAIEQRPDFQLAKNNLKWAQDELKKKK